MSHKWNAFKLEFTLKSIENRKTKIFLLAALEWLENYNDDDDDNAKCEFIYIKSINKYKCVFLYVLKLHDNKMST